MATENTAAERILEVKNVAIGFKTYSGTVKAVRGVTFHIDKGETLAIVGESGSGKSVTSRAIMGILANNAIIESGEVIYKGKDILHYNDRQFAKLRTDNIAMVFQDPLSSLNPVKKIGKQISESLILNGKAGKEEARQKTLAIMKAVGIPEPEVRINQYPFEFSGGMRQRIVIATALITDPQLLICDEPTTALDVTIQAQIIDLIKQMQAERDISIMFITHDLGVVANIADRVAVMYAGKIVETGTVDEIFYDPRHPYTWGLLSSMPDLETRNTEELSIIPGTPPNMLFPPKGDGFAARNQYAMKVDFEQQPPMFRITDTHYAATWLLHPDAPKQEMPAQLRETINRRLAKQEEFRRNAGI